MAQHGRWGSLLAVAIDPLINVSVDIISVTIVVLYVFALEETLTQAKYTSYWILLAIIHGNLQHSGAVVATLAPPPRAPVSSPRAAIGAPPSPTQGHTHTHTHTHMHAHSAAGCNRGRA